MGRLSPWSISDRTRSAWWCTSGSRVRLRHSSTKRHCVASVAKYRQRACCRPMRLSKPWPRSNGTGRCALPWARSRFWRSPRPLAVTPRMAGLSSSLPSAPLGADIDVLSGAREAELTALGVMSGVHQPDGVVGDLGGGSLELIDIHGTRARRGLTRPLGGLALADISAKSLKKADKFVKKTLGALPVLRDCEDRTFTRSVVRGARWRGCTCGRPDIRCT